MLRAAQTLRLVGRERGGDRAAGPGQSALAGLVNRPVPVGRTRQDPGRPLDQNISAIGRRSRDKSDPPRHTVNNMVDGEFTETSRLPEPPASEQHPDEPIIAGWRQLIRSRCRQPGIISDRLAEKIIEIVLSLQHWPSRSLAVSPAPRGESAKIPEPPAAPQERAARPWQSPGSSQPPPVHCKPSKRSAPKMGQAATRQIAWRRS